MKVAFFHGLESVGPGSKGVYLQGVVADVYAPQVNYKDPADVQRIWNEVIEFQPDVVVGSSMGGWFALHVCMELDVVGALINPAVVNRSLELDLQWKLNMTQPLFILAGLDDEAIPCAEAMNWLSDHNFTIDISYVRAGHRIPIKLFEDWWQSITSRLWSLSKFESSELKQLLETEVKLDRCGLSLAHAVLKHFPSSDALCGYSGGGLPHGQESAHNRWLQDLDSIESQLQKIEQKVKCNQLELLELRKWLELRQNKLDWSDPRLRKRVLKSMRLIMHAGSVLGTAYPGDRVELLPKTSPLSYHEMLAFYHSEIHVLGGDKKGNRWDPQTELIRKRIDWMRIDWASSEAPNPRSVRNCSIALIPKHLDGNAEYAVTFERGLRFGRDLIRNTHLWLLQADGEWSYGGVL